MRVREALLRLYTAVKYVVPKTWTDPLYVEHCSTFEKKFPPVVGAQEFFVTTKTSNSSLVDININSEKTKTYNIKTVYVMY